MEAKCTGWTRYYSGTITRVNRDGTYDIKFDDGERKSSVKKSQIKSASFGRKSVVSSSDFADLNESGAHAGKSGRRDSSSISTFRQKRLKFKKADHVVMAFAGAKEGRTGRIVKINVDGSYDVEFGSNGERELRVSPEKLMLDDRSSPTDRLEPLGELIEVNEDEEGEDDW